MTTRDRPVARPRASTVEHLPARPSWNCRTCERAWPCASAKNDLAIEYDGSPTAFIVYLHAQRTEAVNDLTANGSSLPRDLHVRFLVNAVPATERR